jgi:hypothetical protein
MVMLSVFCGSKPNSSWNPHDSKDLELTAPKVERTRGAVPAHKDATISWNVRALEEGNYVIMVLASGTYAGTVVTEQDVVLVPVG